MGMEKRVVIVRRVKSQKILTCKKVFFTGGFSMLLLGLENPRVKETGEQNSSEDVSDEGESDDFTPCKCFYPTQFHGMIT